MSLSTAEEELRLSVILEELNSMDELDGTTELLLGIVLEELSVSLEELGGTDELDGSTELLLGVTLEELGRTDELEELELLVG